MKKWLRNWLIGAEHVHDFKPIRIQNITTPHPLAPSTMIDATLVLMHCGVCKFPHTHTLAGKWTMDDILGKTVTATADALIEASKTRPA